MTAGVEVWAALVLHLCLGRAPSTSSFPKAPSLPRAAPNWSFWRTSHGV